MSISVIIPPQLPTLSNVKGNTFVIGYDPDTGKMVKMLATIIQGSGEGYDEWDPDEEYLIGEIVTFGLDFWISLEDNNIGNIPTEGDHWDLYSPPANVVDGNTITIKIRRKTAASWTSDNDVLSDGEIGLETDTRLIKFGDGTTTWNSLQYANQLYFRGIYTSLANLQSAIPVGKVGDFANVDAGASNDVVRYIWDDDEGWVLGTGGGGEWGAITGDINTQTDLVRFVNNKIFISTQYI